MDHEVVDVSLVVDPDLFKTSTFEEATQGRRSEVEKVGRYLEGVPVGAEKVELPARAVWN